MTFRRLFASLLLSLLLISSFASIAAAAPVAEDSVRSPINSACFKAYPDYQKVTVGQSAYIGFYGQHNCPIIPYSNVTITVDWGDGAVSTVPICTTQICPLVIPSASHAYERPGTYNPVSCINIPGVYWLVPPCLTTQVDVSR